MQENNFEKSVRQKLDELQFTPSEPVWQKIEAVIKKRRERRLVFWLLPLLVTGGLVWWQMTPEQSKNQMQQATEKAVPQPQPTFSKPHTKPTTPAAETNIAMPEKKLTPTNATLFRTTKQTNKEVAVKNVVMHQLPKDKQSTAPEFSKNDVAKTNIPTAKRATNTNQATSAELHNPLQESKPEKKSTALTNPDTLKKATTEKVDSVQKDFQQPIKSRTTKKHLQWSIVSRIGVSNTVAPLMNGFGAKAFRASYPAADYVGGVTNSGNGQASDTTGYHQPTTPAKGLSVSIGAMLKKPVGKRSFIVTGLQYSFFSNHLTIGSELPTDSVVQNPTLFALGARKVFRNVSTGSGNATYNQFTNVYHFIEVPIGFEYQILKNVPLHIQHGFTISRLLASKALEYEYVSNAYYQRSAGLRKTSLNFFTTIDYTLYNAKSFTLKAGPHLQYGLQSIFKNASNNHWLSGGVSFNMSF